MLYLHVLVQQAFDGIGYASKNVSQKKRRISTEVFFYTQFILYLEVERVRVNRGDNTHWKKIDNKLICEDY